MGGGGRGMRVVRQRSDLEDLFNRATSEAAAAFGDGVRLPPALPPDQPGLMGLLALPFALLKAHSPARANQL